MNTEPILVINVELNLGYRPQITIYKGSNIDRLVEDFVNEHNLKRPAIQIIRQLADANLKPKLHQKLHHQNYSDWKSLHQTERSKENPKVCKPKLHKKESPRPALRPSLLEMSFCNDNTQRNRSRSQNEVEREFQKQFRNIKQERLRVKEDESLLRVYRQLTRQNPPQIGYITPEHINFSAFSTDFLTTLEQFFERLDEDDFVRLDFGKFKCLIDKYNYKELFQIECKFS